MRSKNKIINCTFTNNQSYSGSALAIFPSSGTSTDVTEIFNCVFFGTTRNPSFAGTSGYDFISIYDSYKPIVKNCSLIHPSANYTTANFNSIDPTSSGNIYAQTPVFSDLNNLKGADGKYFTVDDGLAQMSISPSKNSGGNSLLAESILNDITGASRILSSVVDMGAYEVDGVLSTVNFEILGIKMYPNPTNGILTLELNNFEETFVTILNINGQVIKNFNVNSKLTTLNVSNLSAGMYFMQITTPRGSGVQKFIKQ
ncbi:MAG: T9SS type A sorting domain-containing protein [Flavobacterium sp.]|nr:T9SS type A sorting domain-containing protein [Flavobacterium sp.]